MGAGGSVGRAGTVASGDGRGAAERRISRDDARRLVAHYAANSATLQALRRSIDEQTALLGLSAHIVLHAGANVARPPSGPIVDWSALLELRTELQLAPDAMRALLLPLQTDAELAELIATGTRPACDDDPPFLRDLLSFMS